MTVKRTGLAPAGKNTTVRFTHEQVDWVQREAIARSITFASMLRELVDDRRLGRDGGGR